MVMKNYHYKSKDVSNKVHCSAATANFWQARPPQWQPHQRRAAAKSRQGLGLEGMASRGGPALSDFF